MLFAIRFYELLLRFERQTVEISLTMLQQIGVEPRHEALRPRKKQVLILGMLLNCIRDLGASHRPGA